MFKSVLKTQKNAENDKKSKKTPNSSAQIAPEFGAGEIVRSGKICRKKENLRKQNC